MKKFKIYSSSAGSGKTYTLTKEYLKLVLKADEPSYFKTILAITFTNDAANEMKERVLSVLKSFNNLSALNPREQKKTVFLLETIVSEINSDYPSANVTIEIIRERARKTLKKIINDYSEFSIGTIDSFTNRIVNAFTEELNIPYNYEIDLDSKVFLQNSVDRLINKAGENGIEDQKKLSDTLEEFILERIADGDSLLSFPSDLARFGFNLFDETVIDAISSLKSLNLSDFDQIRIEMRQKIKQLEAEIKNEASIAVSSFRDIGLNNAHFVGKSTSIAAYFEKLENEIDEKILFKDFSSVLDSGKIANTGAGKQESLANTLIEQFTTRYNNILELSREYISLKAVYKHLYKVSVLHQIDKELEELKREKNIVHLSDFNKKIIKIVLNEPVPFIYERLGERYSHILIDEFQDTSSLQWNNLMPLIENNLGYENTNLIVGDAKQAIYSWRGGDLMQIVHLSKGNFEELINKHDGELANDMLMQRYDTINNHISPQNLNTNFRSLTEIVEFNNDFFKTITDFYKSKSGALPQIYDDLFQQKLPENKKNGGHIEISFINSKDDFFAGEDYHFETSDYIKNTLFNIKKIIDQALEDGFSYKDIAILCRSNDKSKYIAEFLSYNRIKVISSDSLLLKYSAGVRFIISLFKVLGNATDALSKYECILLFHINILNRMPSENEQKEIETVVKDNNIEFFYSYFQNKNIIISEQSLSLSSIYDLVETVVRIFNLFSIPQQSPFIYRFLDVILEYSVNKSNNLSDFMEYWEEKNEKLSINTPKDWDAVTVTSIHKSKGLEYPVVITAFTDWSLALKSGHVLWINLSKLQYQPESLSLSGLSHVAVKASKDLENSIFKNDYLLKQADSFIENLNLIYVAFTRAVNRLYILTRDETNLNDSKRGSFNIVDLIYNYLNQKKMWNETTKNYILKYGIQKEQVLPSEQYKQTLILKNNTNIDWKQKIKVADHSPEEIFDHLNFDKNKEWENKKIYILINIKTLEDIEAIIKKMVSNGILEKNEIPLIRNQITQILSHQNIKPYFSKEAVIVNERKILHKSVSTPSFPDRILIDKEGVIILLFRTEKINNDDARIFKNYEQLLLKMNIKRVEKIFINIKLIEVEKIK